MNRRAAVIAFLGLISGALLLSGTGCRPELDEEELGRIEYRMPSETDIGRKYELPDLSPDKPAETDSEAVDEDAADEAAEKVEYVPRLE